MPGDASERKVYIFMIRLFIYLIFASLPRNVEIIDEKKEDNSEVVG